jgi:hypothetical protein
MADGCEHGNEPSDSTNCMEFLKNVRNDLFLNIHSVRWSYLFGSI